MKRFLLLLLGVAMMATTTMAQSEATLPKKLHSGPWKAGHVQGIAVDTKKEYVYLSFTTMLVKMDMKGNVVGTVKGLLGHLGCLEFNDEDIEYLRGRGCFGEDFLAIKGSDTNMVLSIGAFILLWICLPLFLGLIANILTKAIKGMSLGVVNSLLGVGFSVLKFVLLISCVLNMMAKLNIADQKIMGDSVLLEPATAVLPFIDEQTGVTDSLENYKGVVERKMKRAAIEKMMDDADTLWVEFKDQPLTGNASVLPMSDSHGSALTP